MEFNGIKLEWLHHACFRVSDKNTIIYTDPYKIINDYNDADIILITHDHYDHLDIESIKKLVNKNTIIVAQKDCENKLKDVNNRKVFVLPNEVKIINNITIKTVPSYNINKFSAEGKPFHPKEKGNVGYIFIINNNRIYIAGDTDLIPEMKDYREDIALLPISGVYVMNPNEAAEAAVKMHPKIAIPMHYGSGIGTAKDAEEFKILLKNKIEVEVLDSIDK